MLNLKILSVNGLIKETTCTHIQVIIDNVGSFGVLSNHAPIISAILKGNLVVDSDESFSVSLIGGLFKLKDNNVVITCEDACIGSSIEESNTLLNQKIKNRLNENKARNVELALRENELKKEIRKTGAGHI